MYSQQYLEQLIHGKVEESLTLDYKAAEALQRSKISDISKDVSSFANSTGGMIIYGIKEDNVDDHLPSSIDSIDRKSISKEWIEQIILSNIQPRIDGVVIHPIEINNDPNKVVYIVEIPKSDTAHQAKDQRYYKRFNFLSTPMYDYEVRDVFNRVKHPIVDVEFEIDFSQDDYPSNHHLKTYVKNTGVVLAKYINCVITVPTDCLDYPNEDLYSETVDFYRENTVKDILGYKQDPRGTPIYGSIRYRPLLPQRRFSLTKDTIKLNNNFEKYTIQWTVYADDATPRSGSISLKEVNMNHY